MAGFPEYEDYDAIGLADLVHSGKVTPAELLQAAFARADELNPQLNAVVLEQRDKALARAEGGVLSGPFAGVPMLLKDLGCEAVDFPSNSGSRFFAAERHKYDSEVYLRIVRAGFVTFGRTAAPEFGIGPVTEAQVYGGPTRNPWDVKRTSGGSSGGAGAAVAGSILPVAHGSDGGGSLRIPASNCGLFTLKPTRARLPDGPGAGEGWAGMAIEGFLTRTVRDAAALLDATHGADLGAPYWPSPVARPFLDEIATSPGRLRIAICRRTFSGEPVHADCQAAVERAAKLCASLGHEIFETGPKVQIQQLMRGWAGIVACGVALSVAGQARALGREPRSEELEGVTWAAMRHAKTVSGADYLSAVNLVHATGRVMARFMENYDVLLTPTMAEPPALVGRFKPDHADFLEYRLGAGGVLPYSPFTALFNATGQPAMNVPLHWNDEGLPIGVQFAGRFGEEAGLLKLAAQLEEAAPWAKRKPVMS